MIGLYFSGTEHLVVTRTQTQLYLSGPAQLVVSGTRRLAPRLRNKQISDQSFSIIGSGDNIISLSYSRLLLHYYPIIAPMTIHLKHGLTIILS